MTPSLPSPSEFLSDFQGRETLFRELEAAIAALALPGYPANLYDPIRYFMALGGKRFRPALHILAAGSLGVAADQARQVALAIEVFHNFTLVHDDIMDEAPLRRGQPSVHEKWNRNVAILSGDAMLVVAYDALIALPGDALKRILPRFNDTALGVVEGQQMDMDFETMPKVSLADYLEMVRLKTAVLVGFCLEAAGILANLPDKETTALREGGEKIGIGFQLHDDFLDAFGDAAQVGKQPGGDIIAKKKTILFHLAMQNGEAAARLQPIFSRKDRLDDGLVDEVLAIFTETGAKEEAMVLSEQYFKQGIGQLEAVLGKNKWSAELLRMALQLMYRVK